MAWQEENPQVIRSTAIPGHKITKTRAMKWKVRDISGQFHPSIQARGMGPQDLEAPTQQNFFTITFSEEHLDLSFWTQHSVLAQHH